MKTSALLQETFNLVSDPAHRCKYALAANSLGFKTHPAAEDVERLSSVGALLRMLSKHYEDDSPPRTRSLTQKLFFSNAYSFLTGAAQQLGFKTMTDLDEFGNDQQFIEMFEIAISTATMIEAAEPAEV